MEQEERAAVETDGEREREHGGCTKGAGGEVAEVENREEAVGRHRSCDEDDRRPKGEGGDCRMDGGA